MNNLSEYKIITGIPEYCQKVLNQWKHTYDLNIISMCKSQDAVINILLIRTLKGKSDE